MSQIVERAKQYIRHTLDSCENYPFHNINHTIGVFERATYIAMIEGVEGEELEDLQIACLFHDTGFSIRYTKNEFLGTILARKWLKEHDHPDERIEKIEHIIMATVLFSEATTIPEKIIQDADLDNLGQKESFHFSERYFAEICEIGKIDMSLCTYWQFVYKLLSTYKFHTKTAQKERSNQQEKNKELVKSYLETQGCEVIEKSNGVETI